MLIIELNRKIDRRIKMSEQISGTFKLNPSANEFVPNSGGEYDADDEYFVTPEITGFDPIEIEARVRIFGL